MKYWVIALIAYGVYSFYSKDNHSVEGFSGKVHDELIMYSLTTCGYCKRKAKKLREEGISFVEYYIDTDHEKMQELNQKLEISGFAPQGYGVPIFDAYGYMLLNNPSISKIMDIRYKTLKLEAVSS